MAGALHLPVVGDVSHRSLAIGGGLAVAVGGIWWWRRRQATAAPAATDPNADPNATDTSGFDAVATGDPYGYAGGGGGGGGASGYASPPSNPAWTQAVIAQLSGTYDPGQLTAALGVYLSGGVPTAAQLPLIQAARAVEGDPPVAGANGYPPAIRQASTTPPVTTPPKPPVPPKPPTPPKPPAPVPPHRTSHTVVHGDTLSGIAHGWGVTLSALERANPHAGHPAGNFSLIWPGDIIYHP